MISQIKFYRYNKEVGVIAVAFNCSYGDIKDKLDFAIADSTSSKEDWQSMYMEQYFNADGNKKIADTYEEPNDNVTNFCLYFFVYDLKEGQTLVSDNFGNFVVDQLGELSKDIKKLLDFENAD